jgi:ATP-dependent RNA helicase RhlE
MVCRPWPQAPCVQSESNPLTQFSDFGLATPILEALAGEGYVAPTPIQAQAIPHVLAGRDLQGIAQTGTGKTAAFALPILHRLHASGGKVERKACRALVLSPTRELASQIADSFRTYGRRLGLSSTVVFGGVPIRGQMRALERGVDILVATPGRLIDHLEQGSLRLDKVEILVLDEADHMLDMGFIQPIRRIVRALPRARQNLFFSATMPKEIETLAAELLRDPVKVSVAPAATTVELIDQRVILVETAQKRDVLAKILDDSSFGRTLVFTRTKHGADRVVRHLDTAGIDSVAIHGNKSQGQRERALAAFRAGTTRVLVATDIAARGIDVDDVTHVINFDLPNVPESYVHRIGRTARAGAAGIAISFCDGEERAYLRDIERLIRRQLPVTDQRSGGRGDAGANGHHSPSGRHEARQSPRGGKPRPGHGQGRGRDHGRGPEHGRGADHGARPPQRRGERRDQRPAANASAGDIGAIGFMRAPRRK